MTAAAYYEKHLRNPEAKKFYNSKAWKVARAAKLSAACWCEYVRPGTSEPCGRAAQHVHHVIPVDTCLKSDRDGLTRQANLMSVCADCHNEIEKGVKLRTVSDVAGILVPTEDDTYYYDPEAADKPVRFFQKYVRHYEGKWAGELLTLLPWQQQLIRTFYGWQRRDNGLRRFTEIFLLSGKGGGKTPLMSAWGQYELFSGGEPAAHIVSMGTDYKQAALTMDFAKASIKQDDALSELSHATQYEIRCESTGSKWTTISGTFSGKAGFRPSCVLADEAWEWPNDKLYRNVSANLFKRAQPILFIATNAGESQDTFCWSLYEQAKAVLDGKSERRDLLPAIFEAPESMAWDSEDAARAANPSIPDVITFDAIRPKIVIAKQSTAAEAEYRRLHLSQWRRSGVTKWLDMALWDSATAPIDPDTIKTAALYVGLDVSLGDDLCSAIFVYCTPDNLYICNRNWLPRETADEYARQGHALYTSEAAQPYLTLLEGKTIGSEAHKAIADTIITASKSHKLQSVCYDRAYAEESIKLLEAAGIKCEPIGQGWGVSPGTAELENRLKERTIVIEPNPILRLSAEKVETKQDERGNRWPVKPNAKGTYAGTRSVKIDPITALVTALVEARKHRWPNASKQWRGSISVVSLK